MICNIGYNLKLEILVSLKQYDTRNHANKNKNKTMTYLIVIEYQIKLSP